MKSDKKFFSILSGILLIAAGVGMLISPALAAQRNSMLQSREMTLYDEAVSNIYVEEEDEYASLMDAAVEYNEALKSIGSHEAFLHPENIPGYEDTLNIAGTGIMGTITIEKINVTLPIYHGTGEDVLSKGAGHLEGSSLPTGGIGNHTVISAHSGYPGARLFTDLYRLEAGDVFVLRILGNELLYEVDRIITVFPTDMEELYLCESRDYCTLMTCTPYGINSHRLLVRGHRVYPDDS